MRWFAWRRGRSVQLQVVAGAGAIAGLKLNAVIMHWQTGTGAAPAAALHCTAGGRVEPHLQEAMGPRPPLINPHTTDATPFAFCFAIKTRALPVGGAKISMLKKSQANLVCLYSTLLSGEDWLRHSMLTPRRLPPGKY